MEFSQENGLHIIEDGPQSPTVDIIAVHGLAANPVYTWVKKVPNDDADNYGSAKVGRLNQQGQREILWLKHLLPAVLPNARILKYNYGSTYLVDAPKESLRSIASRLMYLIHNLRGNDQTAKRPMIFIGHSFGGVVIAEALVYAYHHNDQTYKQITLSTCGAVFLGTPFRGSKASSWGKTLASCTAALGLQSDDRLLKTLLPNSEVMERLTEDFISISRELPMKFICFYETKQTKLKKYGVGVRTLVVDKASATIEGHNSCSLVSDHSDMNKFSSFKDEKFILVSGALKKLAEWSHEFLRHTPIGETLPVSDGLVSHQNLPPPVEIFTGREDYLEQMRLYFDVENLRPNSASQKGKIFVLYGLGGSGKTQLALKFAEMYSNCFAEVFFINSSGNKILEGELANIVKQIQVGSTVQEALQWLESRVGQRSWLLIFDNADDPSLNLRKHLPNAGNLIITTRNRDCRVYSLQGNINVEALPPKDAIDLLFKASLLNQQYTDSDSSGQYTLELASEVAKELGYLPLAIIQAGAYIRQNSNFSEYLQRFKKQRKQILGGDRVALHQDYGLSVYATWDLSYQKLGHSARYLLKICAFLHHDIPKVTLHRVVVGLVKGEFKIDGEYKGKRKVALEQWEDTPRTYWTTDNEFDTSKFNNTLSQLTSYSFMNSIGEGQNIYTIHSLVQFWIQDSLEDSERLAIRMGMKRLLCLSVTYKESIQQLRQLLPHLLVLSDVNDIELEETLAAAFVYKKNGLWWKAEENYLQALEERKKISGEKHPDTLTSIDNLASIYRSQGKWTKAQELQEQVLEDRKWILGEEHPDTLTSIYHLALTYKDYGEWAEAQKLQEQALEGRKWNLGEEHPHTLTSMENLASIYKNQSKLAKAQELQEEVLKSRKRILGEQHPDTLTAMNSLALIYKSQGKLAKAQELNEQALEWIKRIFGDEHPHTLTGMNGLALIYKKQGKWTEAQELQEQVLEGRKRILGEQHPDTLTGMNDLAVIYKDQGKWTEAQELLEQVLEGRKRILDEEHPDTLTSIFNLALIYKHQGKLAKAQELEERVLEGRRRILGDEHPVTLTSMHNLAITYQNEGKLAKAEEFQKQVLEVRKQILGKEHPGTLTSMSNLATTYSTAGKWAEAQELYEQALEGRKQILGKEHPGTLAIMNSLATTYYKAGKWAEAQELHEQSLEGRKQILGKEHPDTLTSMNNLATTYSKAGKLAEAQELHEQSLEGRKQILGKEHPGTLISMNNLATTYYKAGKLAEAQELQEQVLELNKKVLGENNPRTLQAEKNLALTKRDRHKIKAVRPSFWNRLRGYKRDLRQFWIFSYGLSILVALYVISFLYFPK